MSFIEKKKKFKVVSPIIDAIDSILERINNEMEDYFNSNAERPKPIINTAPPLSSIKFNLPPIGDTSRLTKQEIE